MVIVCLTLEQVVWVQALAGDIVLCSHARQLTSTVPLVTQVFKWVGVNLMLGGNPGMDWYPIGGEGGRNTPNHLILRKLELRADLMGHSAHKQT